MSLALSRKAFQGKSSVEDGEKGLLHAVVSIFGNKDKDDDVLVKGAFAESIKQGKKYDDLPPGVWYHDLKMPVARTLDAYEDDEGLHVEAQFNMKTQRGRETFYDIDAGIIKKYSFGFCNTKFSYKDGARHITALDWKEWSPVVIPANDATYTVGTKGKYLGDYVEASMTLAAIRAANDALFYNVFYDAIYNYSEEATLYERLDMLRGGLSEFSGLVLSTAETLMRDGNSKAAAEEIRHLFQKPGVKSLMLHAGMTYEDQITSVLEAVEMVKSRGEEIQTLRAPEDRTLSLSRVEQLSQLKGRLEETSTKLGEFCSSIKSTTPADNAEVVNALLRSLELQNQQAMSLITLE